MDKKGWVEFVSSMLGRQHLLGIAAGLLAPFAAIGFLLKRPRHIKLIALPLLINIIIFPLVVYSFWSFAFGSESGEVVDLPWWRDSLSVGWSVLKGILVLLMSALVFFLLTNILGAPFYSRMSENIEQELFAEKPDLIAVPDIPWWRDALRSIGFEIKRVLLIIPPLVLGLMLNFIPLIGQLLSIAFNFSVVALFISYDSFSSPLERREMPVRLRLRWLFKNLPFAIGFGIPFMICPCAFFLVPPLSNAAATRAFCQLVLEEQERIEGSKN